MDVTSLLPPRALEDILLERVRLVIGGQVYDLPALVIDDNERWKESLQSELTGMLNALDDAGDNVSAIVAALTGEPDKLLGLLRSYDKRGILPDDATMRSSLTPIQLLLAVLEVWRAANPLVDIGLAGVTMTVLNPVPESPAPTSSPRRNGAGRRGRSVEN